MFKVKLSDTRELGVQKMESGYLVDREAIVADIQRPTPHTYAIRWKNRDYDVVVQAFDEREQRLKLRVNGKLVYLKLQSAEDEMLEKIGLDRDALMKVEDIKAPMPGLVHAVHVAPGDSVEEGQPLLILEAMKMENVIKSPAAGTVEAVNIAPGETVEKNQLMISFA